MSAMDDKEGAGGATAVTTASAACPDFDGLIASLRTAGAAQFDPVGMHYLESLAKRASIHEGAVKRLLDARLAQALSALKARFDLAQCNARAMVDQSMQQYPHAANDIRQLFDAGDFKGLSRLVASLAAGKPSASLSDLVLRLEQHSAENGGAHSEINGQSMPELKTIRQFRNTWSKLSVDKQVAQALGQAPKNAGPINSHMLMLRSLALMRDISPDYLSRFLTYAETLLCLDEREKEKPAPPKKQQAAKAKAAKK